MREGIPVAVSEADQARLDAIISDRNSPAKARLASAHRGRRRANSPLTPR